MEKLGVEPIQLLTQIFNFLVMMFVLTKLLYKPILKGLEERKKKIEEGLEYSQMIKGEMEKTDKKKEEILTKAKDEARGIVEEAKKSAKMVEKKIIEEAQLEASDIIEKAKQEMEVDREELKKELKRETIKIAEILASKVLEETLTLNHHAKIIDKKIKEIGKVYH